MSHFQFEQSDSVLFKGGSMLFLHDFCVHDSVRRGQCQLNPLGSSLQEQPRFSWARGGDVLLARGGIWTAGRTSAWLNGPCFQPSGTAVLSTAPSTGEPTL